MIKLDEGNVMLKPSQRRQIRTWLKRCLRLGERLGDFILNLSLHRRGKQFEARAMVHDSAGDFRCRARRSDWRSALRELARLLSVRLHDQRLGRAVA